MKSIYSMSAKEVTNAFRKASIEKQTSSKLWDALMYRTSIVRSELSVNDVSLIMNAFATFPKYISVPFLRYLLEPLGAVSQMSLSDLSMILRNVDKLKVFTELESKEIFFKSIKNLVIAKLSNTTPTRDLVNLVSVLRRFSPVEKDSVQRIDSVVTNLDFDKIHDSKTIITFLHFFLTSLQISESDCDNEIEDEIEPFESSDSKITPVRNISLISRLFSRSIALASRFNHRDTLGFSKCLDSMDAHLLQSLGHPSVTPIANILNRLITRDLTHFKPAELVELMNLSFLSDKSRIANECIYRMRDFRCSNAVKVFLNGPLGDQSLTEAVLARLSKYDAISTLNPQDLVSLCEKLILQDSKTDLVKSTLLQLIPIFKKVNAESDFSHLASLYAQLEVIEEPKTIHNLLKKTKSTSTSKT